MTKGNWILRSTYYDKEENECSLCGFLVTNKEGEKYNYCPNCGADMRGVTKNE
jgi:predicted RNA-binding Zn-ribbon protein involved in translation (DUF1610 family)